MSNKTKDLYLISLMLLMASTLSAQQPIPSQMKAEKTTRYILPLPERGAKPNSIICLSPLSKSFKETQPNQISVNPSALVPLFQKLISGQEPTRIVHIGDSHIRSHMLTVALKSNFERDFGSDAVPKDTITYFTSGIVSETGHPGIVYQTIGINGATCLNFTTPEQAQTIADLHPDLIIISLGTNECHGKSYHPDTHKRQLDDLVTWIKQYNPQAEILLTTPPGAYIRARKKKVINPRTASAVRTIIAYAETNRLPAWDLYTITGGKAQACQNWTSNNLMQKDRLHFTVEGYRLQGNLLYQALINVYNDYVAN